MVCQLRRDTQWLWSISTYLSHEGTSENHGNSRCQNVWHVALSAVRQSAGTWGWSRGRLSTVPSGSGTDVLWLKMEQYYWAIQETARILWRPNVHYCLQKSLPLGPTLSHNIQFTSYYRSPLISTLMLSSHQKLGLPNGSLFWPFLLFISHTFHMLCPSPLSLLDHPMNRCYELRTQKLILCNFVHPSVTSWFVDPDIHLNLCSCLSVRGLQHHKTHRQFGLSVGSRQPLALHCDS